MGRFRLTRHAEEDLIRIHQWGVERHGEEKADAYFMAFFEHFERLAERPNMYPAVDHIRKGYRRSVCGAESVYYRLVGDVVEIVAILRHQDPERLP